MNKKTFSAQLSMQLKYSLTHPLFYLCALIFALFVPVNFYIRNQFFSGTGSTDLVLFFSSIPYVCIILVPALCYKTNLFLYEAFVPLSRFKLLLTRFISILILFILLLVLIIPGALFINLFGKIDAGQLFVSLFILIFYGAALISFCLFINELCPVPVLAFVISALGLAVFNSAHLFSVYVQLGNFLTQICKLISFAWHFDAASKGIIDSRDIFSLFFAAVLFLLLSNFVKEIKLGKKSNHDYFISKNIAGILICLLSIFNANKYFFRADCSSSKTYSLSRYSKNLLKNLEEPLKITYYRSSSLNKLYPQIRDISDYLVSYTSQNSNISFLIQDPDSSSSISELLNNYGIYGQQMKTVKNNATEYVNVFSSIVLEYEGRYEKLPFLLSSEELEYNLDRIIKSFITGKNPQVNLVIGNGLTIEDYNYLNIWLKAQGFDVNYIPLNEELVDKLSLCSGLLYVIGDSEINIDQAIAIEDYILSEKGNAFFNVNPYSINLETDWKLTQNSHTNIIEMLENWGITFEEKLAADISCSEVTMYSQEQNDDLLENNQTYTEVLNYPLWISLLTQTNALQGGTIFWATPLKISENVVPYLISSPKAYSLEVKRSAEKLAETDPFVLRDLNSSDYEKQSLILGAKITGPLKGLYNTENCMESNIIIIPDQYFTNSLMAGYIGGENGDYRNFDIATNILYKLNGDEELAQLHSKTSRDTSLYKITDIDRFIKQRALTYLSLFVLIPLLIISAFILIKIFYLKGLKKKDYDK